MAQKGGRQRSAGAARRAARKAKSVIEVRKKKEFTYRGKTLEELQALPFEEQIEMLPSRVRRIFRRGLTAEQHKLLENVRRAEAGAVTFRTHRREMPILPEMVGHTFGVYTGREFKSVTIVPEMIGHYLGEFALTRKVVSHGGVGVGATRSSKFMPLK
ncbi:MAG: 30S ribosomal protein S19 [Euryarchaeota archaeon]|nr:30S ribosomal protein S19 [Euryarchaeota archaeon]